MPPSRGEWERFYGAVLERTGLDLTLYKPAQLQRRIVGIANSKGMRRLVDLASWIASDPEAATWFLDRLAINVSELFRNPERWSELEERVLPELLADGRRLRAWSAGCSYGAEAYTLAAILARRFPGPHRILGTDIDRAALDQARRGVFSAADARNVPAAYRPWFATLDGKWRAVSDLRKTAEFRVGNLLADRFESGWDLILCRNVVIYLAEGAKDALFRRFFDSLRPGGTLFVGGAERVSNAREIGFDTALPFFYRKPAMGDQRAWRNAS